MMQYKAKMPEAWARLQWCKEHFGPESPFANYGRWHRYKGYIYFNDEQDYLFYMLRWA